MNIFNNLHFPAFFYKWKNIKKWLVSNGLRYHFFSFPVLCLPILFHMSRHTFATMCLNNGVKMENVSKMLGHTNVRTTQQYAKVLNAEVEKDFEMLERILS
ncbi:tyrosine-type recombinase/integrase [Bacteroides ovatus]|uniref:tyrosine-type recombinase/integrase n=1 Tax=Bacteroides ovatus TaxID=28116 RepID=UPI00374E0080